MENVLNFTDYFNVVNREFTQEEVSSLLAYEWLNSDEDAQSFLNEWYDTKIEEDFILDQDLFESKLNELEQLDENENENQDDITSENVYFGLTDEEFESLTEEEKAELEAIEENEDIEYYHLSDEEGITPLAEEELNKLEEGIGTIAKKVAHGSKKVLTKTIGGKGGKKLFAYRKGGKIAMTPVGKKVAIGTGVVAGAGLGVAALARKKKKANEAKESLAITESVEEQKDIKKYIDNVKHLQIKDKQFIIESLSKIDADVMAKLPTEVKASIEIKAQQIIDIVK